MLVWRNQGLTGLYLQTEESDARAKGPVPLLDEAGLVDGLDSTHCDGAGKV